MNKILVIGMNPSGFVRPNGKPSPTFKKLEKWMDDCEVKHFSFCNTFDEPGKTTINQIDFDRLCTITNDYDKIIALGGFVASALDKIKVSYFKMPHPSPRNRLLNDKSYELSMINKCKEYICER